MNDPDVSRPLRRPSDAMSVRRLEPTAQIEATIDVLLLLQARLGGGADEVTNPIQEEDIP